MGPENENRENVGLGRIDGGREMIGQKQLSSISEVSHGKRTLNKERRDRR